MSQQMPVSRRDVRSVFSGGRQNRTSGGSTGKRVNSDELAKIRERANANGHEVASRGRISQAMCDAYDAAH